MLNSCMKIAETLENAMEKSASMKEWISLLHHWDLEIQNKSKNWTNKPYFVNKHCKLKNVQQNYIFLKWNTQFGNMDFKHFRLLTTCNIQSTDIDSHKIKQIKHWLNSVEPKIPIPLFTYFRYISSQSSKWHMIECVDTN